MTLNRGHQVRIRADLDPELLDCLRVRAKRPTRLELRSAEGERLLASECWLSFHEATPQGIELIVVLGPKPGLTPIGPIRDELKSGKRYLRGPSPEHLARARDVLQLHAQGINLTAIGRELKITRRQAARIVAKERDRLKEES